MEKRRVVLTFPYQLIDQPITYHLIRDYNLVVNILRAKINPEEEGRLMVEISGDKKSLDEGMDYLKRLGVSIQPLVKDIRWLEEKCTHCTACLSICPTGALSVERKEMKVSFEKDKCIACGLCILACPYRAIEISF